MRFTNFVQLDEIASSMTGVDVSDVELRADRSGNHISHYWNRPNPNTGRDDEYYVAFSKKRPLRGGRYGDSNDTINDNRWSILFGGPEGTEPTERDEAQDVYNELLRGTKAFFDKYEPEALSFSGATSAMDLVYHQFMKRFLSGRRGEGDDRIFIRVGGYDWLRKDVYEKLPPDLKADVDERVKNWKGQETEWLQEKRDQKNQPRILKNLKEKYNNKFLIYTFQRRFSSVPAEPKLVFITSMNSYSIHFLSANQGRLEQSSIAHNDVGPLKEIEKKFGNPAALDDAMEKIDLDQLEPFLTAYNAADKQASDLAYLIQGIPDPDRKLLESLFAKVTVTLFLKNVQTREGAPTLTQKLQKQAEPTPMLSPAQQQQQGARVSRGLGGRIRRPSSPTQPQGAGTDRPPAGIWDD